ncbi:two-component sensor histidine kinase [Streptomyces sp. CB02959]|uniref:sensor histidine kinase n=1 Tax=Streptomyces sp. CB02959 TaxID=2020330 RepID=UPI000C26ED9C|nr:HAMP domain-containing sensor histidine kinase [Streptomyces sp. CB02959]PJN36678.1 two-component sensor histidine kinase [Streptomyces sp. CB02959]
MPPPPALARLHRVRWAMTLLFAATTAACLLVLAVLAVRTDGRSRTNDLDNDVSHRADGLARTVYYDGGTLHLQALRDDDLARSAERLGVLQASGHSPLRIRSARTSPTALPDREALDEIWQQVRHDQETVLVGAEVDGREIQWAAAPVWDDDTIGAAVLVGADPAQSRTAHNRLIRWLAVGCTALVLAAAAVGHLLSGRAMRPALRGLEQQEQFLAEAAHELRTPLATLRLAVESGRTSPARAPIALDEAVRLIDRLGRLVTGLLARARVEAGTQDVELTPLRLDQLVEQTVEELPDRTGVTVTTEAAIVGGDPELLAQAVRNLVENALRHGGGTPVEVTVTTGRVAVRDHGPGVPSKDRTRVFERHVTGAASTGTGTGLAIVRWVAELHGGTAQLSPAHGGGLLAELLLPQHTGG